MGKRKCGCVYSDKRTGAVKRGVSLVGENLHECDYHKNKRMNEYYDIDKTDKKNKCQIVFYCSDSKEDPCVYRKGKKKCEFTIQGHYCNSSVAMVNAMTIQSKILGVEDEIN